MQYFNNSCRDKKAPHIKSVRGFNFYFSFSLAEAFFEMLDLGLHTLGRTVAELSKVYLHVRYLRILRCKAQC